MFDVRNLSVLAYANGFTLWHYKAPGSLAPVQAPGFFDGAADMLASGDMMLLSGPEGGGGSVHGGERGPGGCCPSRIAQSALT